MTGISGEREPPSRNSEVKYTRDCADSTWPRQRVCVRQKARKERLEQQVKESSCLAAIWILFHGGW